MNRFEIEVDGPQPDGTPETLYKYRYFDTGGHHFNLVDKAEIWFASARSFNDPFDSTLQYDFHDRPPGVQLKWAMQFLKQKSPGLNHRERRALARDQLREINRSPASLEAFKADYVTRNFSKFGICCLAASRDDLLMWAHYSQNHTGFCVGISTRELEHVQRRLATERHVLDLNRVEYADELPQINFYASMMSDSWQSDIIRLLTTKSRHWRYEQEYRLTSWDRINFSISLGLPCISEIIMGCRISAGDRHRILSSLKASRCSAKVFQARKSDISFALECEQVM